MHSNGLSPLAFPSLRRMEVEIVAMAGAQIYMLRAKTLSAAAHTLNCKCE